MTELARIAVLGAGHVGPVIARLAVKAGYPVAIATSGDPHDIALIAELMIPGAQPRWARDAPGDADIVVLAVPLHRLAEIDPSRLSGKLVIDAMNYWPAADGVLSDYEGAGSSEIVAQRLAAASTVVKTLNHIGYHELEDRARPAAARQTGRPLAWPATTSWPSPRLPISSTGSATTRSAWTACARAASCSRAVRSSALCCRDRSSSRRFMKTPGA